MTSPHVGLAFPRLARAGLANELMVVGKAHLASVSLGLRLAHPPWGLNRRGYWRCLQSTPLGGLGGEAMRRALPTVTFTEQAYRATGIVDYGDAIRLWAQRSGLAERRVLAVECEGLWGGIAAIDRSREFVRGVLLGGERSRDNVSRLLGRVDPGKLLVGVHVRRGDFAPPRESDGARGAWNTGVRPEWFAGVTRALAARYGEQAQFAVFSDANGAEVQELTAAVDGLTTFDQRHTACSDLLLMSLCDVLVCSPSSYSILAAWLSGRPYVWPAEQCWRDGEWLSLWGYEAAQRAAGGATASNAAALTRTGAGAAPRGIPVDGGGEIPAAWLRLVDAALASRDRRSDLIYYGVVSPDRL